MVRELNQQQSVLKERQVLPANAIDVVVVDAIYTLRDGSHL